MADMTGKIRDGYDNPVGTARASRTLGIEEGLYKYLCSKSPNHMPLVMLQGLKIPSVTFEKDVAREMGLLLSAFRDDPTVKALYKKK
jgi:hypothetical protein